MAHQNLEIYDANGILKQTGVSSVSFSPTPTTIFDSSTSNTNGAVAITLSLDNQTANTVFAGPSSGGATTPAFRALVLDDIPIKVKQTEIDFGSTPVSEASFTITDADVVSTHQILASVAYEAPTSKDLDELDMDGLDLKCGAGSGQFTLYARGLDGYIADKFKINYILG